MGTTRGVGVVARTEAEAAFSELYQSHAGRVLAYCVRRMPRDDARDAAAEVFSVAWRRFDDIPSGDAAIRWLYGVAANVIKNYRRSRRRAGNLVTKLKGVATEVPSGPEVQAVRHDEHQAVRHAIEQLRPRYREVLKLVEWEGLSRNQAAEVLHLSRSAVDQRMHRAYQQLQRQLVTTGGPS